MIYISTERSGFYETGIYRWRKNRMAQALNDEQLQELEMAITICLGGLELKKEYTEVSTKVIINTLQ